MSPRKAATATPAYVPPPEAAAGDVIRSYETLLSCQLTSDELKTKGVELAELEAEHEQHLESAKDQRAKLRADGKALAEKVSLLAKVIRDGKESRDVTVEVREGKRRGWVDVVRLDTNEVMDTRAVRADEQQRELLPTVEDMPARAEPELGS